MATKRKAIRNQIVTVIAALRSEGQPFLGSVNKFARALGQVNDQPSVDVFTAGRSREQKPSYNSEQRIRITARIWGRQGADDIDDLVELVEGAVRTDPTLNGLVIDCWSEGDDTDEGWLGFAGHGALAEVHFVARYEATET